MWKTNEVKENRIHIKNSPYVVRSLEKVKYIYIDILKNEAGWEKRFSDLKSEFKKRPAFLEIVSEL